MAVRRLLVGSAATAAFWVTGRITPLAVKEPAEVLVVYHLPPAARLLTGGLAAFVAACLLFAVLEKLHGGLGEKAAASALLLLLVIPAFLFCLAVPVLGGLLFFRALVFLLPWYAGAYFLLTVWPSGRRYSAETGRTRISGGRLRRLVAAAALFSFALISVYRLHYMPFLGKEKNTRYLLGDEPAYLFIAKSLAKDGDFVLNNNIADRDGLSFFNRRVSPHVNRPVHEGRITSKHRIGLPLLIAPAMKLAETAGVSERGVVVIFLNLLFALLSAGILAAACSLTESAALALATWCIVGLSNPLVTYGSQIYPGMATGLLAFTGVLAVTGTPGRLTPPPFLAGCSVAFIPWMHERYIPLTAVLAVAFLLANRRRLRGVLLFSLPIAVSALGQFAYYHFLYGQILPPLDTHRAFVNPHGVSLGLFGLWVDAFYGLVLLNPGLVFVIPGLAALFQRGSRTRTLLVLLAVLSIYLPAGAYEEWWGGFAPPGRYLVAALPLLVFLVVPGITLMRDLFFRSSLLLMTVFSTWLGYFGYAHMGIQYDMQFLLAKRLRSLDDVLPRLLGEGADPAQLARSWVILGGLLALFATAAALRPLRVQRKTGVYLTVLFVLFLLYDSKGLPGGKGTFHLAQGFFRSQERPGGSILPRATAKRIEEGAPAEEFVPREFFTFGPVKHAADAEASFRVSRLRSEEDGPGNPFVLSHGLNLNGFQRLVLEVDDLRAGEGDRAVLDVVSAGDESILARTILPLDRMQGEGEGTITLSFAAEDTGILHARIWITGEAAFRIRRLSLRPLLWKPGDPKTDKRAALRLSTEAQRLAEEGRKKEALRLLDKASALYPALDSIDMAKEGLGGGAGPARDDPLAVFDGALALLNFEVRPGNAGQSLRFDYTWKCLKEVEANYAVFVHVRSSEGEVLLQNDHWIRDNFNPTSWWAEGEIVRESRTVDYDPSLAGRTVHVKLGFTDGRGKRLQVTSSAMTGKRHSVTLEGVRIP